MGTMAKQFVKDVTRESFKARDSGYPVAFMFVFLNTQIHAMTSKACINVYVQSLTFSQHKGSSQLNKPLLLYSPVQWSHVESGEQA